MKNVYDIIRRPVITEQSMADVADKKYVFQVAIDANKCEILEKVSFHSNPKERQCQRMLKLLHNFTHLTR